MSLWGGSSRGLRATVSQPGSSRWLWIVAGSILAILLATYLLAPYLPTTPAVEPEAKAPAPLIQARQAVLDGAEWTYQAIMPNGTTETPAAMTTPVNAPPPVPVTAPAVYTPTPDPAVAQRQEQERRRLAEDETRRRKAERREYEDEVKRWKPLTWGKPLETSEAGQLIKAAAYSVSPGELIPCETEPLLSNEAPGAFRAFVTGHVYDSKTHRHVIIPQGTEMNLQVGGKAVIFGDSRLPIEAMTMTFPGGDWMKFGKISVSDVYGTPGFTGKIDRHLWRIVGSIFINSVLRGGTTALVANSYDEGVTNRMGSAAVAETAREGQQLSKQVLRTDPTISVAQAYGCYILLEEPIVRPNPYQVVSQPAGLRGQ